MKQLSVFIDESGDFSFGDQSSEYYLITLVFHDQEDDIYKLVKNLDEKIHRIDPNVVSIHTGPADYRLFQVCDYICSFELLAIKQSVGSLAKTEKLFFYKPQELKKQFLKEIHKKRI